MRVLFFWNKSIWLFDPVTVGVFFKKNITIDFKIQKVNNSKKAI
jgi:hypothetical protein